MRVLVLTDVPQVAAQVVEALHGLRGGVTGIDVRRPTRDSLASAAGYACVLLNLDASRPYDRVQLALTARTSGAPVYLVASKALAAYEYGRLAEGLGGSLTLPLSEDALIPIVGSPEQRAALDQRAKADEEASAARIQALHEARRRAKNERDRERRAIAAEMKRKAAGRLTKAQSAALPKAPRRRYMTGGP